MSATTKSDSVRFTTKGQVVIPAWLRKQFDIEDGTKAVVQATPDGILLKPVTAALIKRGRGIIKRKPGDKPFAEELDEHKKAEKDLKIAMPGKVLDSFALIAYFRDEQGAEMVENLLVTAGRKNLPLHMTDVNYAEVKYSIVKKDGVRAWEEAAKILQGLPIDFHPTTRALADSAADFKVRFKMSLADAFAAALAKERKAELVTGDPEFKPMEKELKIAWLI